MFRPGYVLPYEGESISHYLGRWRRYEVNSLSSPGGLGRFAGIGSVTPRALGKVPIQSFSNARGVRSGE